MPFEKGISGNPAGKKPGTKDKISVEIRERFQQLIDENFDQLRKDIKEMKPSQRADVLIRLAGIVLPKLQSVSFNEGDFSKVTAIKFTPIPRPEKNINLNSNNHAES